ncbi:MAG: glycoside hydrolase family 2 [Ruminococcaceae bacterium]|nr:glycoside hydrolase family 2 [Oscillospiraceae bacterium]
MKKHSKTIDLLSCAGESFNAAAWDIYPRPQLKRNSFFSLNGCWDFCLNENPDISLEFNEKINVPFAPQSVLSGLRRTVPDRLYLHYRKSFSLPEGFNKGRVILNFGAVDQEATVYLNGIEIGTHIGGYEAFSFDITEHLCDTNTLYVVCKDNLNTAHLPYGKQREKRGGMWYTAVSGIWQTVWLESVPKEYIKFLKIDCDDKSATVYAEGVSSGLVTLCCDGDRKEFPLLNGRADINIENPCPWSPENPKIYNFTVRSGEDMVESYLAFRKIDSEIINGVPRITLNGKPYFFHGLLDQGYFSDGIYTPAEPEEYKRDILSMKALGFNTLRKHIKIEPEIFYYYCDTLGMVVFQDMVNNGKYSFLRDTALPTVGLKRLPDKLLHTNTADRKAFSDSMTATVKALYNHPSICYWTIFNEGWGQFCSQRMYERLKALDKSRIIDTTSGWFYSGESDVKSLHVYFKPVRIKGDKKPIVLSEFGGYSFKEKGHCFNPEYTYGYKFFNKKSDFQNALYRLYIEEVLPNIKKGLCGAIYTQLSDVEDETNGLLSYDRKINKADGEKMLNIAEQIKEIIGGLSLDKQSD